MDALNMFLFSFMDALNMFVFSFMALGESQSDVLLRERLAGQAINQPAILCYTSGTTANPKGALLSQDNITWTCASANETYGITDKQEVRDPAIEAP